MADILLSSKEGKLYSGLRGWELSIIYICYSGVESDYVETSAQRFVPEPNRRTEDTRYVFTYHIYAEYIPHVQCGIRYSIIRCSCAETFMNFDTI